MQEQVRADQSAIFKALYDYILAAVASVKTEGERQLGLSLPEYYISTEMFPGPSGFSNPRCVS